METIVEGEATTAFTGNSSTILNGGRDNGEYDEELEDCLKDPTAEGEQEDDEEMVTVTGEDMLGLFKTPVKNKTTNLVDYESAKRTRVQGVDDSTGGAATFTALPDMSTLPEASINSVLQRPASTLQGPRRMTTENAAGNVRARSESPGALQQTIKSMQRKIDLLTKAVKTSKKQGARIDGENTGNSTSNSSTSNGNASFSENPLDFSATDASQGEVEATVAQTEFVPIEVSIPGGIVRPYNSREIPPMTKRPFSPQKGAVRYLCSPPPNLDLCQSLADCFARDPLHFFSNKEEAPTFKDSNGDTTLVNVTTATWNGERSYVDFTFVLAPQAAAFKEIKTIRHTVNNVEYTLTYKIAGWCHHDKLFTAKMIPVMENGNNRNSVPLDAYVLALEGFIRTYGQTISFCGAWQKHVKLGNKQLLPQPEVIVLLFLQKDVTWHKVPGYLNDKGSFFLPKAKIEGTQWFNLNFAYREDWCRSCFNSLHNFESCQYTKCMACNKFGHISRTCPSRQVLEEQEKQRRSNTLGRGRGRNRGRNYARA